MKNYAHDLKPVKRPVPQFASYPPRATDQCPMETYLRSRELDPATALFNGWYLSERAGDAEPRVVMPSTSTSGAPYWQARAINPQIEKRYRSPSWTREDGVIAVFPMHGPVKGAVVAEGPMDALAAAGLSTSTLGIALMGAEPPEEVWEYVYKLLAGLPVRCVADRDAPGEAMAWRMRLANKQFKVKLIRLLNHKDLAEVPARERERWIWQRNS